MNTYRDELIGLCQTVGRQIAISTLEGAEVRSNAGEDLGRLEDILVDPRTGKVTFAVLGNGERYGLGAKRRPVPWEQVIVRPQMDVIINTSLAKLEAGPAIESEPLDMQSPAFVIRVYEHYGVKPVAGTPTAL